MRVISGLNYDYKLRHIIQECIKEAYAHPFETYIFIAEEPLVVEKIFFQYTHYLINIEVMSWHQFLYLQQVLNHLTAYKVLSNTEYTYYLYLILKEHHFDCFTTQQPYPLIKEMIPLMKTMNLSMMDTTKEWIDQPKLNDFSKIYQLLLSYLDEKTHLTLESLFDLVSFSKSQTHLYIEADQLYQSKQQDIICRYAKNHDVTLLYTYQDDSRLFNMPYHSLCQDATIIDQPTFITENLFKQSIQKYQEPHSFYTFVSSHPYDEVKRVVYTLYQKMVDENLKFHDFMIVYPDQTYQKILLEVLEERSLPHHLSIISSCQYDKDYQDILTIIEDNQIHHLNEIKDYIHDDINSSYFQYLESLHDFDKEMSVADIKDFFISTYTFDYHEQQNGQDYIHICSMDHVKTDTKKHIFFLGMNETICPHSFRDTNLLLDEDIRYLREQHSSSPLTTLETLGLHYQHILKALSLPHLSMTFSYSQGTLSGEVRLPSTLYHQLNETFSFHPLPINTYLSLHDFYIKGGKVPTKEKINSYITQYKQSHNQPVTLSKEILQQLYSSTLSVSQIETYNKCPFLYFIQYGLGLNQPYEELLQSNELGSLTHYILSQITKKDINIPSLVDQYISKNDVLLKKLKASPINQYFIQQLKTDLLLTIDILKDMIDVSSFEIYAQERRVYDSIHGIPFQGIVDRMDIYQNYVSIIDYKSSAKDIDLNLAIQGFQIQMLVYLKMITKKYHKDPAAVLYFNTKKRILSQQSLDDSISKDDIQSLYRYGGYVIDDNHDVIQALDPSMERKSNIIPLSYVKSKDTYKGHLLTPKQLSRLFNEIEKHIIDLYQHMMDGDISISPKGSDQKTIHTQVNPCHYCPYHHICQFDVFYNDYQLIQFYDVEKMLGGEDDAV